MDIIFIIVLLSAAVLMAIAIGSNDIANAMGTTIGAGVLREREAFALGSVFIIIGALFFGHKVSHTIGVKIIVGGEFTIIGGIISLASAGVVVLVLTWFQMPTSTTHAIIGGVAGWGVAFIAIGAVAWGQIGWIALSWIISPFAGIGFAFSVYYIISKRYISRIKSVARREEIEGVFTYFMVGSACFVALSMGANDTSHAVGVLFAMKKSMPAFLSQNWQLLLFGALFICVGTFLLGHKVSRTVGKGLTELIPSRGFSAQISTAIIVFIFSQLGIPVSTSHTLVGSVIGVGIVRGIREVRTDVVKDVSLSWLVTLPASFALAFVITLLCMPVI
jgi:PiT family inorganic phosphate transporter